MSTLMFGRRLPAASGVKLLLLAVLLLAAVHCGCAVAAAQAGGGGGRWRRVLRGGVSRPGSPMPNGAPQTIIPICCGGNR
ncbi:hypothetical protein OsJ_36756 [Oryza sativa Japonica Group]|uniref:Uncharacterized protein n=1 Tax=Oryza sativa subsp. japonica TaxID=39947 RepID=B9GE38_ORYSJ|nr:hypothetical protein OsJ_36756 [Oryza sativa Japonica Group]KAF2910217.1 hypothetical protein DAI22_11g084933 [Oryza sativa Japonica Group]